MHCGLLLPSWCQKHHTCFDEHGLGSHLPSRSLLCIRYLESLTMLTWYLSGWARSNITNWLSSMHGRLLLRALGNNNPSSLRRRMVLWNYSWDRRSQPTSLECSCKSSSRKILPQRFFLHSRCKTTVQCKLLLRSDWTKLLYDLSSRLSLLGFWEERLWLNELLSGRSHASPAVP